jgi:hypothetical protein
VSCFSSIHPFLGLFSAILFTRDATKLFLFRWPKWVHNRPQKSTAFEELFELSYSTEQIKRQANKIKLSPIRSWNWKNNFVVNFTPFHCQQTKESNFCERRFAENFVFMTIPKRQNFSTPGRDKIKKLEQSKWGPIKRICSVTPLIKPQLKPKRLFHPICCSIVGSVST